MIHCPLCDIQFSPGYTCCPRCKEFPTPRAKRREYLADRVATQISAGEELTIVRESLIEEGFGDADADSLIGNAVSKARSETRSDGLRRFLGGLAMLAAGGVCAVMLLTGVRSDLVLAGLLIFLAGGATAAMSGLYAMLTGRESGLAGRLVSRFDE